MSSDLHSVDIFHKQLKWPIRLWPSLIFHFPIMKKIIYALAFVHLMLIGLSIFHLIDKLLNEKYFAEPLALLSTFNYSVWRYGFFSPDVGKSIEVEILIYEDSTTVKEYRSTKDFDFFVSTQESANRFYGFKAHTAADTVFLDICARSASTRMLNLHPEAWRINYTTRSIRYPTMEGYRKKEPIKIIDLYSTAFELY